MLLATVVQIPQLVLTPPLNWYFDTFKLSADGHSAVVKTVVVDNSPRDWLRSQLPASLLPEPQKRQ